MNNKLNIYAPRQKLWFKYINHENILNDFQITYSEDCKNCDVLVVYAEGGYNKHFDTSASRRILITGEPTAVYKYSSAFLNQFTDVITSQTQLTVNNDVKIHHLHQCNDLFIGRNYSTGEFNPSIADNTYTNINKTKLISILLSNKRMTEYHQKRLQFLHKIIKDIPQIDVFGDSIGKPVLYKDQTLLEYKYQIVIENSIEEDYWTEKLGDCIFARTEPIYCGCPNIHDYFSDIQTIDINDYSGSLQKIREIINTDINMDDLTKRREKYLEQWQLYNIIKRILYPSNEQYDIVKPFKNSIMLNITNKKFEIERKIFNYFGLGTPLRCCGINSIDHEYACREGHKRIIRYAKKNNLPYVTIFEDDAYPCDNCFEKTNLLVKKLKQQNIQWDILCLGICGTIDYDKTYDIIDKDTFVNYDNVHGATAYIVKSSAYDSLLNNNTIAADFILSQRYHKNIKILTSKEMLFVQRQVYNNTPYFHVPKKYNLNQTQIGMFKFNSSILPIGYSNNLIKESNLIEKVFFKIIIPNYNCFAFIKPCLDSILNQTYQNFKIIFIDDKSTDRSIELVELYQRKNPDKIIIIKPESKKYAGGCRNLGIDYPIDSEYCMFIDSDDYLWSKDSLSILYQKIIRDNPDMILFNWNSDRAGQITTIYPKQNIKNVLEQHTLCRSIWCSAWSRVMKTSKITKFLEDGCMFGEDTYQLLKMYEQGIKIIQIEDIIYTYRQRYNSVVHTKNDLHELTKHIFYKAMKNLFNTTVNHDVKCIIQNRLGHDRISFETI